MRTQAALQVQQLDRVELGILLAVLAALAAFGFYQGFRRLWKARVIEDAPTAKVRSAHQGYVELVGEAQAMRGEPIIAPLSKAHCCWYRYTIEKKSGKEWDLVRKEVSDNLFLLRDETGECIVDPEGAEVTSHRKQVWYGDGNEPMLVVMPPPGAEGVQLGPVVMRSTAGSLTGRNRYTEELILAGDPLYALGAPGLRRARRRGPADAWRADHRTALEVDVLLVPIHHRVEEGQRVAAGPEGGEQRPVPSG